MKRKNRSEASKQASFSAQQVKEKLVFRLVISNNFLEDYSYWLRINPKIAQKTWDLIEHITRDPFKGKGEPEPLKHIGSGMWSRKINQVDRLVYKVDKGEITFLQCRFHYDD